MVKHHQSHTKKSVTLKIFGTEISVTLPAEVCTTVGEVKELVATEALVDADKLVFYSKSGAYISALKDVDQIATTTYVKGIKSFKPQAMEWPNPIGIIGCGYHGLKTAMTYSMDGNENYVMFDRFDMVGGYCWITGANKTSRLQTEFGSFHVWWGQECVNTGKFSYPNCNEITLTNPVESVAKEINMGRDGWSIWPYKWEIQAHFKLAAEKFGLLPHIRFKSNVAAMSIVGAKDAESRYYELVVDSLAGKPTEKVPVSVIYNYPGSLTQNRIIEYPGEDLFDGEIRYGMNDDTPYEKLKGSTIAILGNGAFAVENARTCLECEGVKAYIVTRRKNLASPRIPCWFVHQGPIPTPGGFVLKTFEPMYKLVDFGDPWEFWSVHSNAARTNVSIIQNSRFGIGDVTFLMVAWGLLEYVVATVKRFSRHTLHLSTGDKIEDVQICLKALGLLGDYAVDRLHNMKEMVGNYCGGDWRRVLMIDATGMNAANFSTFSTGIGTTDFARTNKFLHDYPQEFYKIEKMGYMKTLPKHAEEPDVEKPAYVSDVKYAMTSGIILTGMIPKIGLLTVWAGNYKHRMYHKTHTTDRVLEVALFEWNKYQETWKSRGIEHDYVPYPYTKDIVKGWFEEYSMIMKDTLTVPIDVDGPGDGDVIDLSQLQTGPYSSTSG